MKIVKLGWSIQNNAVDGWGNLVYFAKFPNLKLSHWSQRKSILQAEKQSQSVVRMKKSWVFWVHTYKCVCLVSSYKKWMCVFLLNLCNNILSWWFEFFCKSFFCFWFVKLTDVKRAEMSGVTGVVTRTQKRLLSRWRCGDPAICPSSAECTVTNSATRSRRTSRNWGWGNVLKVGTMTNINIIIVNCRSLIVLPN